MGDRPYERLLDEAGRTGTVLHRDDIYGSGPPVDAVSEEILTFVLEHTGQTVLDVGSGVGPYVERLRVAGRSAIGIDTNEAAVAEGRMLGRDLRCMSAYDLEFADASFDSVILVETLEHLANYESALAEAARVARDTIVVTVPDISAIPVLSQRMLVPWHLLESTHVNFFTPDILLKILLRFASSAEVGRLGHFYSVEDEPVFMHATGIARLR